VPSKHLVGGSTPSGRADAADMTAAYLIGAVYLTEWVFFWSRVSWHSDTARHGRLGVGCTLLTFPDGSRRSFGHMSSREAAGCRH
jgi:hypothetical protein